VKLRDKYGWPVERVIGAPVKNFIRLLIHTSIRQTLRWRNCAVWPIGYVAMPISDHNPLRSGSKAYSYAICVSVAPFVLVSPRGDMLWRCTVNEPDYRFICLANERDRKAAFGRWKREQRKSP
jgi:hypothetical protein